MVSQSRCIYATFVILASNGIDPAADHHQPMVLPGHAHGVQLPPPENLIVKAVITVHVITAI